MPLNSKLMCSSYLGPTCYFSEIIGQDHIVIEAFENYTKQTIRNRCYILGPNGPQLLNIPVQKISGKQHIKDVRISYAEDWQKLHWKSIQTAYGSSAFFEILAPELEPFYFEKQEFLLDLNLKLTELVLNWMQETVRLKTSTEFTAVDSVKNDLRFTFNTKDFSEFASNRYMQINASERGFYPNLSIIDLLFNEGPMAWELLHLKTI